MSVGFDLAIVGAGIVGATIAACSAPRARVLLLEAEPHPGMHATGRSAALFAEAYGPPAVRALTRASRGFFLSPPAGFSAVPLLAPRGALFVAAAGQLPALQALHRRLRAEGSEAQWLDAAAARARVPVLRPEAVAAALLDPAAMDIDVDALLQAQLRRARAAGAQLATGARIEALRFDGRAWQLACGDGRRFAARRVVNAAGAWADGLAAMAGVAPLGVEPRRRSAFVFDPPAAAVGGSVAGWPAVIDVDEGWYFKPDAGLLLGSPANADPVPAHDVQPEELDIALGIHRIAQGTTLEIRRPRRTWAGLRSFVADGEPLCGPDPAQPAFFWAAALGGYGIQTSPAFGELAAALLCGGPRPVDEAVVAALAPGRGLFPPRH